MGNKGLEKGKRRINWLWYKPVSMNEYNSILTGKSNTKYQHGIPPHEIRDKFIDKLKQTRIEAYGKSKIIFGKLVN